VLATTIFGVGPRRAGRRSCARLEAVHVAWKQLDVRTVARQILLFSTAMSVGQGAQRGFQFGVHRAALTQDPR
jgi:hypothetical protein